MKHQIRFLLDSRFKKSNCAPIRMHISYGGVRLRTTTGLKVNPKKWDEKTMLVKSSNDIYEARLAHDINTQLRQFRDDIDSILSQYARKGFMPRPAQLKSAFLDLRNPKLQFQLSFITVYDEFVKVNGAIKDWTPATYEKFAALKQHIINFKTNPEFENFNETGLGLFIEFLREKEGLKNSTIGKNLGFLKWFLKWAHKKAYHNVVDYETFVPRLKQVQNKPVYLTVPELNSLINLKFERSQMHLEQARDVFIFCCFSGLRHSDVYNLRRSNIINGKIQFTTIKTTDTLIVELNDVTSSILRKYECYPTKDDKALPVAVNQRMNMYLKIIAEMAGIDTPVPQISYSGQRRIESFPPKYSLIGTHTARRTFVTLALSQGVPTQIVMDWTGHSSYKAMKPYIAILNDARETSMNALNNILPIK